MWSRDVGLYSLSVSALSGESIQLVPLSGWLVTTTTCFYVAMMMVCVCVYARDQWLQYSQRILNFDCIPISKQSTKCLLPTLLCMNRCAPTSPCMEQCLPSQVYSILPSNNLQILFVLFIYCINWVIMNITRSWKNLINYTFTSNKTMQ